MSSKSQTHSSSSHLAMSSSAPEANIAHIIWRSKRCEFPRDSFRFLHSAAESGRSGGCTFPVKHSGFSEGNLIPKHFHMRFICLYKGTRKTKLQVTWESVKNTESFVHIYFNRLEMLLYFKPKRSDCKRKIIPTKVESSSLSYLL